MTSSSTLSDRPYPSPSASRGIRRREQKKRTERPAGQAALAFCAGMNAPATKPQSDTAKDVPSTPMPRDISPATDASKPSRSSREQQNGLFDRPSLPAKGPSASPSNRFTAEASGLIDREHPPGPARPRVDANGQYRLELRDAHPVPWYGQPRPPGDSPSNITVRGHQSPAQKQTQPPTRTRLLWSLAVSTAFMGASSSQAAAPPSPLAIARDAWAAAPVLPEAQVRETSRTRSIHTLLEVRPCPRASNPVQSSSRKTAVNGSIARRARIVTDGSAACDRTAVPSPKPRSAPRARGGPTPKRRPHQELSRTRPQ
jgi:hypothetical protein